MNTKKVLEMEMLKKNNELFTNACLLLMIGSNKFLEIIEKNGQSNEQASQFLVELLKMIDSYQITIINEAKKIGVDIMEQDFLKKLENFKL